MTCQAPAVFVGEYPAFADQESVPRQHPRQPFRSVQADFECSQIAVVDADKPGRQGQSAFHFGFVMDFDQDIHAEVECGFLEKARVSVPNTCHDQENCVRAP